MPKFGPGLTTLVTRMARLLSRVRAAERSAFRLINGVDCITAVAVGIDDGRAGFDLAIRYQLSHLGQGLAGQFLHVCRNVILIHQFGFARKL